MFIATPKGATRKFRKRVVTGRGKLWFSHSAEREYLRFIRAILLRAKEKVNYEWPNIKMRMERIQSRMDAEEDEIDFILAELRRNLILILSTEQVRTILDTFAKSAYQNNVNEFIRMIKRTLNLDVAFTSSSDIDTLIRMWSSQNAQYILSIPSDYLDRVAANIRQGVMQRSRISTVADEIERAYGVSESKAHFLARDQMSKLNGNINQHLQREAGVTEYEWQDSGDARVRDSHAAHHGKRYPWNKPPADTGHPGEDYNCRCEAIPVFDMDKLNIVGAEY